MPKITYTPKKFKPDSMDLIEQAVEIAESYAARQFQLTVRQLYYQMVSKGIIVNTVRSYKNLASLLNDARLAGYIDWNHLEDRTRNLKQNPHWENPARAIKAAADWYAIDKWLNQDTYVEVWIEKEALSGVVEPVCQRLDVPFFACRGYTSQSELWNAAMRVIRKAKHGRGKFDDPRDVVIVHLGDHDPSGIDMTRDILDRFDLFCTAHGFLSIRIDRIALNMDQINDQQPPPNPAKTTDSRFAAYLERYGDESWELDALTPEYIDDIITNTVMQLRDEDRWDEAEAKEIRETRLLERVSGDWERISEMYADE